MVLGSFDELDRLAVGYRADPGGRKIDQEGPELQSTLRSRELNWWIIPTDPVVAGYGW